MGTSRGSRDVIHDDQGQAGASGRRVLVASLVLKGQAQARSPEASGKGWQDGGHRGAHEGVITRGLWQTKTTFFQDNLYRLSPFKLAVVGSLPA